MGDKSSIEWTSTVHLDGTVTPGATWNPITGCTKVSPGCAHCYAETLYERFHGKGSFSTVTLHPERLNLPLTWRKPRRVFVNSMSDLFHEDVPFEFIDRVFAVMALASQHTFQVLTKRPERMREYMSDAFERIEGIRDDRDIERGKDPVSRREMPWPLPNVWLGTSTENQHFLDLRVPELLATPAAVRFLSCEPLLGPLNLDLDICPRCATPANPDGHQPPIDWVIVGGESGPRARPMDIAWARSIVEQCRAAGVAVFVKQLGAKPRGLGEDVCDQCFTYGPGGPRRFHGSDCNGRQLQSSKGGDPGEWPKDLRVREMPV